MAYLFSSLALLVSVLSFFYLRAFVKRRTDAGRIPADTREEVRRIINQIDDITYRDGELVGERVKSLKALLEEADRRIAVFRRETEGRKRRDALYSELGRTLPRPAPEPEREEGRTQEVRAAEAERMGARAAGTPSAVRNAALKKEEVLKLAASGFSPAFIASRLNMTIAEIEMILALRGG